MAQTAHFGPQLFRFLRQLAENNQRQWFKAEKARYENDVRDPLLGFISDFGPRLRDISSAFRADPRPVGGSLFRIYRDTRFAKDKSPYKTHAAAQFRHKAAKDVHAPGFYLHLEPGQVFGGAGIWHPDSAALGKIRRAIVERPEHWRRVVEEPRLAAACTFDGESLKRPPRGFDAEHPLIDDLKRKDFIAVRRFDEAAATSPDFLEQYTAFCRTAAPYIELLTRALELEW